MNKGKNKIANILIGVGLVLIGISMCISLFRFDKILTPFIDGDKKNYEEITKKYGIEEFNSIVVDTSNDKINIVATDSEEIKLTYYEKTEHKYSIKIENNTLIIKRNKYNFLNWTFGISFAPTITIEVPSNLVLGYDIKTSNSKIEISNLEVNKATLKTSNGKIIVKNINSQNDLSLTTSNDPVEVNNINVKNLNVKTSNGNINLNEVDTISIDLKTSNAKIEMTNLVASKDMIVNTSNGPIIFKNLNCPRINLDTSNAKISGNIRTADAPSYYKTLNTSNGTISINDNEYGKKVEEDGTGRYEIIAKTSNANMNITIKR